ncbi:MAG: DUF4392 domain-containing protein, partial [Armatimonadetes bacterium]|nr:DUF4392 domain-containing protein [Armatimonadota bacterium]
MPEIVGEYVDRACTVEMRPGRSNLSRGVIHRLYEAARKVVGKPLTYAAADLLLSRVKPGDSVFIVTGAAGPPLYPVAEVDGYLGAVAIARAMLLGAGAQPVLIAEERCWEPMRATCRGADINLDRAGEGPRALPVLFEPLPLDRAGCERRAAELLNTYKPKAVLAIERLSPNRRELIHGATGINYDDVHAKAQYLFDGAKALGIAT